MEAVQCKLLALFLLSLSMLVSFSLATTDVKYCGQSLSLSLSLNLFPFSFESLLENLIYLSTLLSETETRCLASILGFLLYSQIGS